MHMNLLVCDIFVWHQLIHVFIVNTRTCSFRVRLEVNEKEIYENLALLVRWVDFESRTEKEKKGEEEHEKARVMEGIKRFQFALEEVVRLVYEIQLPDGISKTLSTSVQRR